MSPWIITFIGILIPFAGTLIGAAVVLFFKSGGGLRFQITLTGFASGVMIAASIWSLLIPAIEMSEGKRLPEWFPSVVGFLLGILLLLLLDRLDISLLCKKSELPYSKEVFMSTFAVILHNIPEGMAVGVIFAGALEGAEGITMADAMLLSMGIAAQNLPEGAIVSVPLQAHGMSKRKAFGIGVISGIVEPIAAAVTILLTALVKPILPYVLALAAGAMIYVVANELIPKSQSGRHARIGTVGISLGFCLMMLLDVALG